MSSVGYNNEVEKVYKVEKTEEFDRWLGKLKDGIVSAAITNRIERFESGNIGDSEHVGDGLNELRIHYGGGYRVYWFRIGKKIVLLVLGGKKASQKRDIRKAKKLMMAYREEQ